MCPNGSGRKASHCAYWNTSASLEYRIKSDPQRRDYWEDNSYSSNNVKNSASGVICDLDSGDIKICLEDLNIKRSTAGLEDNTLYSRSNKGGAHHNGEDSDSIEEHRQHCNSVEGDRKSDIKNSDPAPNISSGKDKIKISWGT